MGRREGGTPLTPFDAKAKLLHDRDMNNQMTASITRSGSLEPGSRRQAAVRVRLGEKEALDATLRFFEDRIGRWGAHGFAAFCWSGSALGHAPASAGFHVASMLSGRRCLNPSRCRLQNMEYYAERRLKRLGLLDDLGRTTWDGFFEDGIA